MRVSAFEFLKCSTVSPETGKTVVIIGASLAGLSTSGYLVYVWDIGSGCTILIQSLGMVAFGMPDSRLSKDALEGALRS